MKYTRSVLFAAVCLMAVGGVFSGPSGSPSTALDRSVTAAVYLDYSAQFEFMNGHDYTGMSDLIMARLLTGPHALKLDGRGVFRSAWGGRIVIGPAGDASRPLIRFTGVPRSACPAFVTRVIERADPSDYGPTDVSIGGGEFVNGHDRKAISTACRRGGDRVSVAFMGPSLLSAPRYFWSERMAPARPESPPSNGWHSL